MLDFIGTIVTAALMTVVVNALIIHMEIGRGVKLALAGIAGLWIGLAAAASASGWLTISHPFPVIGLFVAIPLVATAINTASAAARAALLGLPTRLLVGPQYRPRARGTVLPAWRRRTAGGSIPVLCRLGRHHYRRFCRAAPTSCS